MIKVDNIDKLKNEIINRLKSGETLCEIEYNMFGTRRTIHINRLIDSYGLHPDLYSDKYLYMNKEWLREAINNEGSVLGVCKKYHMSRTSVTRYAQRYGLYETKFSRYSKNNINENYFVNIDSADKAYWLGFIMADGNVYQHKDSNRMSMEIKLQQSDIQHLKNLANMIGFPEEKVISGTKQDSRTGKSYSYASIRTYNNVFCSNLLQYGVMPRKTGHEVFPRNQIPIEFQSDFVRGFWDGDGSVFEDTINVCSTSIAFICTLSSWLCHRSIHYSLRYDNHIYRILISKYSYKDFLDIVYYPNCFGLTRKVNAAYSIRVHLGE